MVQIRKFVTILIFPLMALTSCVEMTEEEADLMAEKRALVASRDDGDGNNGSEGGGSTGGGVGY